MTLKINGATGGSVSLDAPDNTSPAGTDVTLTLPVNDGDAGQYLQTDGTGTLSWQTVSVTPDAITEGNTTVECVDTGSNGHITFDTEGSEAARFDSSGRLLVGTNTSIGGKGTQERTLQIAKANAVNEQGIGIYHYNSGGYSPVLEFGLSKNNTLGSHTAVSSGDNCGSIIWSGSDGTEFEQLALIAAVCDGTPSGTSMPGRIMFFATASGSTNPSERMRIQGKDDVISFVNIDRLMPQSDNTIAMGGPSNRWTAVYAVNGTIQTSDERQKTEIASSTLGADFIKALRPVSYKWIEGGKRDSGERDEDNNWILESVPGQRTHWGFIAQEVKEAVDAAGVDFGGWVLTDKDDSESTQALRYDQFIAPLTKALQEALAKIETLETANASLEARLTALEGGAS